MNIPKSWFGYGEINFRYISVQPKTKKQTKKKTLIWRLNKRAYIEAQVFSGNFAR